MHGNPVRISCLVLESPVLHLNNVKVRCVGKDEYIYDSYVRNNYNDCDKDYHKDYGSTRAYTRIIIA